MPVGKIYDIEKIFDVVLAFNSENNLVRLLDIILTKMMEITNSDAGTVYIIENEMLHFRIIRNATLNIFQTSERDNDCIALPPILLDENNITNISAYSAIKNEIVQIDDVYEDNRRFNFDGPKKYDKMTGYRTHSMLVMPLCAQGEDYSEVIGVIQLMNAKDEATGEPTVYGNIHEPPVVPALSNIAANTLANLIHMKDIRDLFHSFVAVMTKAIDERSPYNNNHTQNVALCCERFVRHLSTIFPPGHKYYFTKGQIDELNIAALLHDIGKIITPLSVMDKAHRLGFDLEIVLYRFDIKKYQTENDRLAGRITDDEYNHEKSRTDEALELVKYVNTANFLTPDYLKLIQNLKEIKYINRSGEQARLLDDSYIEALSVVKGTLTKKEREIMQDHVALTGRLLDKIASWKFYKNVPDWARNHHEYLDGTGYPLGLKAENISTESRIITIMDIFEALTASDRPYKKAVPIDYALKILNRMADEGKLDKELVMLHENSKLWEEPLGAE